MNTGNFEGKGKVYDENGSLILRPAERLLFHAFDEFLDVSEGSSLLNMRQLFGGTAEKVQLFITDQRLVGVVAPDPGLAARDDMYLYGMADAIAKGYKAYYLRKHKAFEFCVIEYDDIEGFWVRDGKAGFLFLKSAPDVTRKAIMYRKGEEDRKFHVLKDILAKRLPTAEPEDSRGSFLLGARYPFVGRRRIRKMKMKNRG